MYYKNHSLNNLFEYVDGILCEEQWKGIIGYDGLYLASSFGRIKSLSTKGQMRSKGKSTRREKILCQRLCKKTGYLSIGLTDINVVRKTHLVHRIVAILYIENPLQKKEVNHKKGIKTDNRWHELEWATPKENNNHALLTGLASHKYGEDSCHASLFNQQVLDIFNSTDKCGTLAEKYNVDIAVIYQIKNGKNWSSITGKYYVAKSQRLNKDTVLEIYNSNLPVDQILSTYNIDRKYYWALKTGRMWARITNHTILKPAEPCTTSNPTN